MWNDGLLKQQSYAFIPFVFFGHKFLLSLQGVGITFQHEREKLKN
jgi:hypothetical protein